jgi:hypothetical protein
MDEKQVVESAEDQILSLILGLWQSLAKSASPFSCEKIVSTDHLIHFWR